MLSFEGHDFVFNLAPALRVFLAQGVRNTLNLEAFEPSPLIELITCLVPEMLDVPAQGRLVNFAGIPDGLYHVMRFKRIPGSIRSNRKISGCKVRVQMRIQRAGTIMIKSR